MWALAVDADMALVLIGALDNCPLPKYTPGYCKKIVCKLKNLGCLLMGVYRLMLISSDWVICRVNVLLWESQTVLQ